MKIATWNVNSIKIRLEQTIQYIKENDIDILCLQETKTTDENFPINSYRDLGYHCIYTGEKTYNGVAIISKSDIKLVKNRLQSNSENESKRFIEGQIITPNQEPINILNVYTPNGGELDSDKYHYKLNWLKDLFNYLNEIKNNTKNIIILGDFNIAPEKLDVNDKVTEFEAILTSQKERNALKKILEIGFIDLFRAKYPDKSEFSWWDYRNFAFKRNLGYRIDLILANQNIANKMVNIQIDKNPRKNERPSDHTPVILEIQ